MTLGERIAEKRKENGLSQEALGEELGVSRQSVYKWESGSGLPEIEKLIAMSRLFGVTIGWLLGVEETPPTPEPAQPSDSGELTEQQLRMVEEIVGRYIAFRQPAKKRRWPWAAAAAAGAALLLTINSINGELQTLRSEYGSLQNSINFVSSDVNIQISSITSRVEEILKSQNALTASCDVDIISAGLAENTVTFSARAVPKTYTDGMEAVFLLDCGSGPVEFPGTLGAGREFTAELTCDLTDSITISVVFIDGEVRETQLLDSFTYLYTGSLPEYWPSPDHLLMWKRLDETGQLTWTNEYDYISRNSSSSSATNAVIGRSEIAELHLGLFRNQELLAWLEPCEKPSSYRGFEDCDFYRLPDLSVTPGPGDVFHVAALMRDNYGREIFRPGLPYALDEDGTLKPTDVVDTVQWYNGEAYSYTVIH